jgi:uncharacterized protein YcnI
MNDTIKNNSIYFKLTQAPELIYASEVHPKPTKDELKTGVYTRYFVSQKNVSSNIIEVDKKQYDGFVSSKFYTTFSIQWKIPEDVPTNMKENMIAVLIIDKFYPGFNIKMRPFVLPNKKL